MSFPEHGIGPQKINDNKEVESNVILFNYFQSYLTCLSSENFQETNTCYSAVNKMCIKWKKEKKV